MCICLLTIWRLFMKVFYVSKLKLEGSAGYNLFALCRIHLILLGTFSLTYMVYWTVCSGKKDTVTRTIQWHFPKQIFNPNKKSKRDCLFKRPDCLQRSRCYYWDAKYLYVVQSHILSLKETHHEPWGEGKHYHDCKFLSSQVLTVMK